MNELVDKNYQDSYLLAYNTSTAICKSIVGATIIVNGSLLFLINRKFGKPSVLVWLLVACEELVAIGFLLCAVGESTTTQNLASISQYRLSCFQLSFAYWLLQFQTWANWIITTNYANNMMVLTKSKNYRWVLAAEVLASVALEFILTYTLVITVIIAPPILYSFENDDNPKILYEDANEAYNFLNQMFIVLGYSSLAFFSIQFCLVILALNETRKLEFTVNGQKSFKSDKVAMACFFFWTIT